MRPWLLMVMFAFSRLVAPTINAKQDEGKKGIQDQANAIATQLKGIQDEYQKNQREIFKAYREAKTHTDKIKALKADPKSFQMRALRLAELHPETPTAVDALLWVVDLSRTTLEGEKAQKLLAEGFVVTAPLSVVAARLSDTFFFNADIIADAVLERTEKNLNHKDAPRLLAWVQSMLHYPPSKSGKKATNLLIENFIDDDVLSSVCKDFVIQRVEDMDQLRSILSRSNNRKVRAAIHLRLAEAIMNKNETADYEAVQHLEKVVNDYAADAKEMNSKAKSLLSEIQELGIGKKIPEIEGKDLKGKPFKLSEYRGKVVLIEFWDSNNDQWVRQIRNKRSLVSRLEYKPFVFFGVYHDKDKEALESNLNQHQVTWRACWGNKEVNNILKFHDYATLSSRLYLIDHTGVIRKKWDVGAGDKSLDQEIDKLVKQAESATK